MSGIKDYSTTAASNNTAAPNGWPEGMAPSAVNDTGRQTWADIRSGFEALPWFNLGYTCTQASATTFTIAGDKTADFTAYRAIKVVDSSTLYGWVVSSSYSAPNTTVTVQLLTGSLSSTMNGQTVSLSTILPSANIVLPKNYLYGLHTYAADAGASDTYAITLSPSPVSYETGMVIKFKANTANTGAATINVNSIGAKTIKKNYNSDLATNDIVANQIVEAIYDGTNFQLLSPIGGSVSQAGSETYAADAGASDTYVITLSPAPAAYTAGMVIRFKANTANTGAATLNANSLGAITIKKNYDSDLADNDIKANQIVSVAYDGTNFQLQSPISNVLTVPAAAAQADQETGTSTTTYVSPGRQQYHASAVKGWVKVDMSASIVGSYNVSSITDNASGKFTANWTTSFSSTNYAVTAALHVNSDAAERHVMIKSLATGSTQVITTSQAETLTENSIDYFSIAAFGDQ